jgi:gentisate 1,2-dioxygenase
VSHEVSEEAVLFSASDRAAQKALGLWREENNIPA